MNPLRDPQDRRLPRIPEPCALVIFGVTGDLSRKKLLPAIYDLANRGLLPPGFSLVGFARRDWADEDFSQIVHDSVKRHARTPFRQSVWDRLAATPPDVVVVLKPDHVRDVDLFVRWYGARAFGPWLYWRDDVPRTELEEVVPGKELPIVIALIDLDEGVRMVGEVVDVPDDQIEIGMSLRVDFNTIDDDLTLPIWKKA